MEYVNHSDAILGLMFHAQEFVSAIVIGLFSLYFIHMFGF